MKEDILPVSDSSSNPRNPAQAAVILALRDTDKERRRNRKALAIILKKKINLYQLNLKHYEKEANKHKKL